MRFSLQAFSFFVGFIAATIFWWLVKRMQPLWEEILASLRESREEAKARRSTTVEENHRRNTFRRAQGMHLAAPLFALNDVLETPRVLAPPLRIDPDAPPVTEYIVARTLPYMPSWPEMASLYNAPSLSLGQAISGGVNLVVTGQPGAGKTVALAHLASQVANRDPSLGEMGEQVPFLYHIADMNIPEGEIKEVVSPIVEMALKYAPVLDYTRLPNFIEYTFKNGQALLLLDGFDELAPSEQTRISSYLKILLEAYPKLQIVTTGCPEHLDGLVALGFEPLALMPWKPKQQNDFIDKWGLLWNQTVAIAAWNLNTTDQIVPVDPLLINAWLGSDNHALTPLELTLKVWAGYAGDSQGPSILDAIATHVRRLAPRDTPLAALETLGMQVALSSQAIFDSRSAREWVKSFELPEDSESAGNANENNDQTEAQGDDKSKDGQAKKGGTASTSGQAPGTSGLLNKMLDSGLLVPAANNRMRFQHPIFGGYLAGRGLATVSVNANSPLLQQPDWAGKLLAMRYFAAYGDASALTNAVLLHVDQPLYGALFNAARWLRDAPRNAVWRGKIFSQLANLLNTEGIPLTLRAQAVAAFYWSGDPGIAPLFRQFLRTNSFEMLQLAALGCGAIGDVKAIDMLSQALYAPSPAAQRAGCLALVAIGTSPAMETVARALLHGEEDLRRAAAEALANDPKEGYSMLKEGLTMEDILLRHAAIYGLARVEEDWAIEELERVRVEDDQWVVRNSANEVIESKAQMDPRIPQPLTAPSEKSWLIAFAGKQGVGISPGSPATEILVAALKSDLEEERLAALPYLKQTPTEGVITNLYHAMYRDDPELREAVFLVLCELAAGGIKLPNPQQFGLG